MKTSNNAFELREVRIVEWELKIPDGMRMESMENLFDSDEEGLDEIGSVGVEMKAM